MKTEDIDKRIGMPDVDAEWARFEQEVIGKETKASKRSVYSWIGSFAIAASVVIVAGLFFLNHDSKETEQILTEISEHPISHDVVSEPSSSEKPTELIAKTSPTKQVKIRRENNTATDYIYDCDEESAVFPGGEEALKAFIEANLELPDLATEYGAKGRIFMSFVIDSVGEVSDIRILERPRARISYDTPRLSQEPEDSQVKIKELITLQLGEEATRILSLMPRWRPAILAGKPVKTRYHLPIIFDATKAEQQKFLAKNQNIKPESFKDSEKSLQHQPHKDTNPKGSIAGMAPRKELALANADAPATTGLDISHREYTGEVQKFNMDDVKDLAFESVDQALQNIASADLSSGTTMRLRGTEDYGPSVKDIIDSTLILVNGEPLPESLKQRVMGNDMDDMDTYMPRYFSQQGLLIDSAYVHKDSYYTEKYGGRAKYGLIEIKVMPDTYCDAYVRKHPKLMKKYTKVEGYVVNNEGKPLTEAWVHVKRDFIGAATDSTGHYVFWVPKKDVTLCAEQTGYRTVEFSPADNTLVMHLEPGTSMRLRGNSEPDPELRGVIAGLPDAPPNDSILYIVNGVPQPKENNKWLSKRSFLDYFHGQHLLVDSVKRNMNEEAKQRYIERFGMAAKHGVVEYFCVEDTLCDYYMNQHEELKASRRRVSGVVLDENDEPLDHTLIHILQFQPEKKIWGVETTDSLGNFAFWVPRTDIELHFKYIGYKAVVVEPTDTFLTVRLVPNSNVNDQNLRLRGNPKPTSESQGQIAGLLDTPPNDSILYLINGKPQPKENNKWLSKDTYLDYFKKQHLHVERVMDYTNVKQRYIEKFGEAAKYGVVEYICVEDTRGDYYMEQHEELKANRRRVSGVVLDENDKPLGNTKIFILHDKKIWGTETTDSSGNYAFWVPRTDVTLNLTHYGYKAVVVEPTDTFQTIHLLPTATMQSTK